MKNKHIFLLLSIAGLYICGCTDERVYTPSESKGLNPVNFRAMIDHLNETRADDSGFADGDRIGIFMVDFENGIPSALKSEGNHADNQSFSYDEKSISWNSSVSLFFKDNATPADFYGYYPYISDIVDVEAVPFSVKLNQSTNASSASLSGYESSDLLWAKTLDVSPKSNIINLSFNHILAGVEVNLIEGDGFDNEEWNNLEKTVMIDGTIRDGLFNIATGSVDVNGTLDGNAIIANPTDNGFRAVVLPQNVNASTNLVTINIGSDSYGFQKNVVMTYLSGKLHKFTFEVSKKIPEGTYSFELIGEAVTVWESDPLSHDGLSKAYQIVDVKSGESLELTLKRMNIKPSEIVNLKLTGSINDDDFYFIRDNMRNIQALNLAEISIRAGRLTPYTNIIPELAFANLTTLKHVVLPKKLTRIEMFAFAGTSIEGSLCIPEGVEFIGESAFTNYIDPLSGYSALPGGKLMANNNLTGTLELPSTLEYIGAEAFRACNFTGRLILPKSLKYVGKNVFMDCRNFTGEIHFPESLVEIEETDWCTSALGKGAFYGMTGLTGNLELPQNIKIINGFGGLDVSNILFPDGAVEIGAYAFINTKVAGNVVIPEGIVNIGNGAFLGCNAKSISLPSALNRINEHSFALCSNLCDTLVIPQNVEVIDMGAFRECHQLQAIVLPSKLSHISGSAFENCYSLQYIHCDAKEPPSVDFSAFDGVAKDNFTVEVPKESVEAYRNAAGWSEFKRISAYRNFVARPSKYNVLNKGGKREIVLNADTDWEMIECPSWCHIDKTSGSLKTSLNLTVDAMAKGSNARSGRIVFKLKGNNEYTTSINVGQYDYEYDEDSYVALHKASKGNGIDLFLVGDGYDAVDISSGLLMKDMKQTLEYFFDIEPYATYKEYFNVYTGIALSEDSGVEQVNRGVSTKFHTVVPNKCNQRITSDWRSALDYCAEICTPIMSKPDPKVGVILLANYEGYDGMTYSVGESFCSLVTKSTKAYPFDARGLVQHEAGGHGIGWLADEYIYHYDLIQKCECSCCKHAADLLAQQGWGFGLNVSLNGKYKEVPWTHMIFNPSYEDIVDVYEGGYFHGRGVYRSEYNSCMNNNIPYHSSWSRQLIVQRIMNLAGETFSLDSFYAKDKRDMGRDFTTSRSLYYSISGSVHGNPPVFIKDYKFGKKGGNR